MIKKPDGCEGCPLKDKGVGYVPDNIPADATYLMLGEAPGKTEVVKGKPFQGKAGFVLDNWLLRAVPTLKLAKDQNKLGYANVLRCLPPEVQGRPYPKGQEKTDAETHCRRYDAWPASVRTVILLGEHPQRLHFGEELAAEDHEDRRLGRDVKGVMGRVGRVYEKDGKRWVFAPHPAFILRQPALVTHGQACLKIAAGADKVLNVDYQPWEQALQELS